MANDLAIKNIHIEAGLGEFCQIWRDEGMPGDLRLPQVDSWWPYVLTYELVDVDLGLRLEDDVDVLSNIKALYDPPPTTASMDIIALTRMSESAALNHKNTRVSELRTADIGYRSDELWVITGETAFFKDVTSAAIILVQQRATQDSMAIWTSSQRSEQYEQLSIENRRKSALDAVQQFSAFSEAMSNYRMQESQLDLGRAATKIGWASALLAFVALLIGALQIYIAIVSSK